MSLPAERCVRAWLNAKPGLVGEGKPLALGVFTQQQRSPDSGAYAVLSRSSQAVPQVVAEDGGVDTARLSFMVYAGTEEASEAAVCALAGVIQSLNGSAEPCGDTGVTVLTHDNFSGPMAVVIPSEGGERFAWECASDFVLVAS